MNIKYFFKRFALVCAGAMALTAATLTGCSEMEEPTGLGVQHVEQGVIAATGGELTFTVHPGAMDNWTLTFLDADGRGFDTLDWVRLSKASGTGKTGVTATIAANPMGWQREATVIVNAGDRKIPIPIVQAASPSFHVTPEELKGLPASEGGDYIARTLTVESNIKWYAVIVHDGEPAEPWVSFLPGDTATYADADTPAVGDASLDLAIQNWEQLTGDPRTATVKFYAPDGTLLQEVPVSQNPLFSDPGLIVFHVTPEELKGLPASEGGDYIARTLTVESNIKWYAVIVHDGEPTEPWVSFLPGNAPTHASANTPAYGDAELDLQINNWEQTGGDPRTAKVRFYSPDGKLLQEVPVSQNPNPLVTYFRVTPASLTGLPWHEGRQNVNRTLTVESNIKWYAVITRPDADRWILFGDNSDNYGGGNDLRQGDAAVGLNIDNYLDYVTTGRTATVTFYGEDGEVLATVPVSQNPRPWLRIDRHPEFEGTSIPGAIRLEEKSELTTEATLFNSDGPITYTWYAYGTPATKDKAIPIPPDMVKNGSGGKTITVSGQWIRDTFKGYSGYFYCVASSPETDEDEVSNTAWTWVSTGGV